MNLSYRFILLLCCIDQPMLSPRSASVTSAWQRTHTPSPKWSHWVPSCSRHMAGKSVKERGGGEYMYIKLHAVKVIHSREIHVGIKMHAVITAIKNRTSRHIPRRKERAARSKGLSPPQPPSSPEWVKHHPPSSSNPTPGWRNTKTRLSTGKNL